MRQLLTMVGAICRAIRRYFAVINAAYVHKNQEWTRDRD